MKKITIAIDGHSSSGKSTLAKDLARQIGYTYIDSGAMYRAVTLYAMENDLFDDDKPRLDELRQHLEKIRIEFRMNETTGRADTYLNGRNVEREIRSMEVANLVSPIAAVGFVREEMVRQQQAMGRGKGIVMDGRDIGTIVFPDAELKVFVTASPQVRAQRRQAELAAKGEITSLDEVLANLQKRDHIDSTRKDGPLRQAEDALVLDNSLLSIPEQNEWLIARYQERAQEGK